MRSFSSIEIEPFIKENRERKQLLKFYNYQTTHRFHLVDPSPWPISAAFSACIMASGGVTYFHKFIGGWSLLTKGLILVCLVMGFWWRDVIREATFERHHNYIVQKGLRLGVVLFIVSEVMFFFAFFWAFFHSSLAPVHNIGGVWPPKAITPISPFHIPLTNSFFLVTSGATLTWCHHALRLRAKRHAVISGLYTLFLAVAFTANQLYEYITAPFSISDGIYGSCFYMTTGFHGFHVIVGTIGILVAFVRIVVNHFTNTHHLGFESSAWYWHFVDVVWILLYLAIYWWGGTT